MSSGLSTTDDKVPDCDDQYVNESGVVPSVHSPLESAVPNYSGASDHGATTTIITLFASICAAVKEKTAAEKQIFIDQAIRLLKIVHQAGKINARDKFGRTFLMHALSSFSLELVKATLKLGADVNCRDFYGNTAAHYAVYTGENQFLMELLLEVRETERNPQEERKDERIATDYFRTAAGNVEALSNLSKINLNSKNCDGKTALYIAVEQQNVPMVKLLVKFDAKDEAEHSSGKSPLHRAVEFQDLDLVVALLNENKQININAKTYAGATALSLAKQLHNATIAEYLLRNGAIESSSDDSDYDE